MYPGRAARGHRHWLTLPVPGRHDAWLIIERDNQFIIHVSCHLRQNQHRQSAARHSCVTSVSSWGGEQRTKS